jgi:hypothetical protein
MILSLILTKHLRASNRSKTLSKGRVIWRLTRHLLKWLNQKIDLSNSREVKPKLARKTSCKARSYSRVLISWVDYMLWIPWSYLLRIVRKVPLWIYSRLISMDSKLTPWCHLSNFITTTPTILKMLKLLIICLSSKLIITMTISCNCRLSQIFRIHKSCSLNKLSEIKLKISNQMLTNYWVIERQPKVASKD